jgi:hypothetical protein
MAYNPNYRAMGMRPRGRFGATTNPINPAETRLGATPMPVSYAPGARTNMGSASGEEPLPAAPVDASGESTASPLLSDTQQGSNPWSNLATGDMMAGGSMDDFRRRMRMRGISGGGAAGGGGGDMGGGDLMGGGFEGAMTPTAMMASGPVARGRATYQHRAPRTATETAQQALAAAAAEQAIQEPAPAPAPEPVPMPLPVVEFDHSRDYKGSPMGGGGQLPPDPAPAPTPAPTGPATVPVGVPPNDQTMYAKNGGRARRLGLGKFAGASRGKRSPVTFDAKGNVLFAKGGRVRDDTGGRNNFSNDRASRWLAGIGQDMVSAQGLRVGDGARDSHTIVNPDLVTRDANGNLVTPRYNIRGSFENESTFGGPWHNQGYLTLAALGAGGAAAGGAFGGAGTAAGLGSEGLDLSLMDPLVQGTYAPITGDAVAGATAAGAGTGAVDTSLLPSLEGGSYTPIADTPVLNAPVLDPYQVDVTANGGETQPFESGYPDAEGGPSPDPNAGVGHIDINGPETGGGGGSGPGGGSSSVNSSNPFSRALDWARNNPTSAVRAASGLAGIFGGRGGGGVPQVTVDPVTVNAVNPDAGGNPLARAGSTNTGAPDPATDPLSFLQSSGGGGNSMSSWSPQSTPRSEYIQKILDEAEKAGSPEEQEVVAGRAAADAAQRAARAKEAMTSRLVSQGINPNDPRGAAGEMQRLADLDNSKVAVGAENVARANEKAKGFSQRAAAAGLALQDDAERGRAQLAQQQLSMESARMAESDRQAENSLRARLAESAADRQFRSGESAADRAWRTGESATDRSWRTGESAADRNLRAQQINAGIQQQNSANGASRARNIGSAFGAAASIPWGSWYNTVSSWFADGGRVACKGIHRENYASGGDVEGPGTSTSDSIDAKLSDGEFVVNAEGVELLDKLAPGFLEKANDRGMRLRRVRSQGLRRAA